MTYRVRRKFTSTTFCIDDQICKIWFRPEKEYRKGYWFWKVGFAIGKSNRQLNDWFNERKNKRSKSLHKQITGRAGMKAIRKGFQEVLRLRWIVQPGDCIELDCTSGDPDRQFHAWSRWHRYHPEWVINYDEKVFYWYRPPYPDDAVWKSFNIIPITPVDRAANTAGEAYFDCFRAYPKGGELSMEQTLELVGQVLPSGI
jgi:hypothetical protein